MTRVKPTVTLEQVQIDDYPLPTVTVSGVPNTVDVADTINPLVHMEYPGTEPLSGIPVDFFVHDSLGVESMGRDTTDVNGDASAVRTYYVSEVEAGNTLNFVIVTRSKSI